MLNFLMVRLRRTSVPLRGGTAVAISAEPATPTVVSEPTTALSASDVFDMLSNTRRRYVLYHLREQGEASVRELSRRIAAWENDVELSGVTSKQRKRVYTALHQTHLPRLDDNSVVEYDRDRGEVRPDDGLAVFEPYLEQAESGGPNWPRYYFGIGLAAMALAIGIITGVPALATVEPGVAGLVVGTAVLCTAAVHATEYAGRDARPSFPDLQPSRWRLEPPADD